MEYMKYTFIDVDEVADGVDENRFQNRTKPDLFDYIDSIGKIEFIDDEYQELMKLSSHKHRHHGHDHENIDGIEYTESSSSEESESEIQEADKHHGDILERNDDKIET